MTNDKLDIIPPPIKKDLDKILTCLWRLKDWNPIDAIINSGITGLYEFHSKLDDLEDMLNILKIHIKILLPYTDFLVDKIEKNINLNNLVKIDSGVHSLDSINQVDFPIIEGCYIDFRKKIMWSEAHVKNFRLTFCKDIQSINKLREQFNMNITVLENGLKNFKNSIVKHIKNVTVMSSPKKTSTEILEKSSPSIKTGPYEYDVAISFAGENREIAEQIAKALKEKGINVFYDELEEEKVRLWGKNLRDEFIKIYRVQARYVLILISKYYPIKDWTNFEFDIAKNEAKRRKSEYILPVRLDDTKIVGLKYEIKYINLCEEGINGVVGLIVKKLLSTTV
ncbi:MAG: toll/interleukin-1 receptor domain-containing protein [Halanaerobiales bacterium]|nr:toll/interleukin-1 receptor domain-containing protein [Halanaerobiales bacterium]